MESNTIQDINIFSFICVAFIDAVGTKQNKKLYMTESFSSELML
jgi:hypothetical protein